MRIRSAADSTKPCSARVVRCVCWSVGAVCCGGMRLGEYGVSVSAVLKTRFYSPQQARVRPRGMLDDSRRERDETEVVRDVSACAILPNYCEWRRDEMSRGRVQQHQVGTYARVSPAGGRCPSARMAPSCPPLRPSSGGSCATRQRWAPGRPASTRWRADPVPWTGLRVARCARDVACSPRSPFAAVFARLRRSVLFDEEAAGSNLSCRFPMPTIDTSAARPSSISLRGRPCSSSATAACGVGSSSGVAARRTAALFTSRRRILSDRGQ